ncbi:ferredoxin [Paraburkholderia strydomiana]|nr:ferredoxin [Paraburkholderia strydomiana]
MTALTGLPSGKTYDVAADSTLLAVGESIGYKCNGEADYGSCHLFVQEGRKSLSRVQRLQNDKLNTLFGMATTPASPVKPCWPKRR